jgi:hypothetical protein
MKDYSESPKHLHQAPFETHPKIPTTNYVLKPDILSENVVHFLKQKVAQRLHIWGVLNLFLIIMSFQK